MARLFSTLLLLAACAVIASGQPNQCVALGGPLLSACQAELATVQKTYALNTATPITDAQVQAILTAAKAAGQPSPRCCQAATRFDAATCACDPTLPPALKAVGLDVSPTGLQSAQKFTGQACNFNPKPCP